jgi:hypothetical protein
MLLGWTASVLLLALSGLHSRSLASPGLRDIGPFDIRRISVADIYSATFKGWTLIAIESV